jgi:hypothetical protein
MRSLISAGVALLIAVPAIAQDADRVVGGGIQIEGWKGRVDRRAATQGRTVNDSRLRNENGALRLSVGPAGNFWNPSHHAHGNYEVSATFKEHKMAASHPHSYGIFIGGADLESDTESLMYCIAYGNGTYSIKTFRGANVQTLVDRAASPALVKADANGEATNTIGWRVQGGSASCIINGQSVHTVTQAQAVVSHNLELTVSGLRMVAR